MKPPPQQRGQPDGGPSGEPSRLDPSLSEDEEVAIEPGALLSDDQAFADIDRHFARLMERWSGGSNPELALAAALVSRSRGEGNICLDLPAMAGSLFPPEVPDNGHRARLPSLDQWLLKLREAPVVGKPGEFKPLILDARGRLYLRRYWEYETRLAQAIEQRAGQESEAVDWKLFRAGLRRCFPAATGPSEADPQQVAAAIAVQKRLCVISGGPGTGKTHTVGVLLALLLEQARGQPLRIALAAPTGKAAARLQESIKKLKPGLPCGDEIKAALPEEAFTVHRLLGSLPDSACLKYNAENPLPFDVVVVDEASMVDLALMSKLFAATAPAARIILLGDKDQLASVEAGAVLGDICHGAFDCQLPIADCRLGSIQPALPLAFPPIANRQSPIANRKLPGCIAQLRKNYRFGADNGILALSTAINRGDAERALELLSAAGKELAGIRWAALPTPNQMKERLREQVLGGFGDMLRAPDPRSALQGLNRFRILCALRQGPHGVETSNRLVELILAEAGLISTHSQWYSGRPVMVTRNDPHLKLFNGDIGIILPAGATGEPRAWFLGADNALRSLLPLRLPAHETVFAMTVHKSQGSEFENVLLVLPDRVNPVLTRELVYTGVTRASRRVELWFTPPVFRAAVARRVERTSGLREALWGQRS